MVTALVAFVGTVFYATVAGALYRWALRVLREKCGGCALYCDHQTHAFIIATAWPLSLCAFIMAHGVFTKESRRERARAAEIAEAEHQAELAKIRNLEDQELTAQLDRIRRAS